MMKHIFIGMLSLFISFSSLAVKKAKASEFEKSYITHEQFVMMNDQNQREVVLMIMKYMSSAEGTSKIQEIVKNGTPEEKAKWKRYVEIFSNFMIDSAHADEFTNYNNAYTSAKGSSLIEGENRCIYAGWISRTTYDSAKKKYFCNHPSNVKDLNSKKKVVNPTGYKSLASCPTGPNNKQKIICNPVIYGFESGEKPLCADASPVMHNSSLQCMIMSTTGAGAEERLKKIAKNLANNQALFQEAIELMFFSCACPADMGRNKVNKGYRSYMRPHRTCYGLLNQIRSVLAVNDCKAIEDEPSFSILVDFLNKIQTSDAELSSNAEAVNKKTGTGKEIAEPFDTEYGKVIDKIYNEDKDTQAFCKSYDEGTPVKPVTPVVIDPPKDDPAKDNNSCKIICAKKEVKPEVKDEKGGEETEGTDKKDPVVTTAESYICKKMLSSKGADDKPVEKQIGEDFEVKLKSDIKEETLKEGDLTCSIEGIEDPKGDDNNDDGGEEKNKSSLSTDPKDLNVTFTVKVVDKDAKDVSTDYKYRWYNESEKGKDLGTATTYDAPKTDKDYKICVDITPTETVDSATKCDTVPAKAAAPVVPPQGNGQQQQPQMPRRQPNIHINYGIR